MHSKNLKKKIFLERENVACSFKSFCPKKASKTEKNWEQIPHQEKFSFVNCKTFSKIFRKFLEFEKYFPKNIFCKFKIHTFRKYVFDFFRSRLFNCFFLLIFLLLFLKTEKCRFYFDFLYFPKIGYEKYHTKCFVL